MRYLLIYCDYCYAPVNKQVRHVNYARRLGRKMYCNSLCSQQGRITSDRNDEQRAKNRLYGMRWREKNKHKRELYRANKILNKNKKPTIKLNESQSRLAFAKLDVGDTKIFDLPIGVQK